MEAKFLFSHFMHSMLLLHSKQKQNQGAFAGFQIFKSMAKVFLRLLQVFIGFCGDASGEC